MRRSDIFPAELDDAAATALARVAADPKATISSAALERLILERLIRITWFGPDGLRGGDRRISLTERGRLTLKGE